MTLKDEVKASEEWKKKTVIALITVFAYLGGAPS